MSRPLALALVLAVPASAHAFRDTLDADVLSVSCMYYEPTVGPHPFLGSLVGEECTLRMFVAYEGEPAVGIAASDIVINHLHAPLCLDDPTATAAVSEVGGGVYEVALDCEPEDLSLQVSLAGPGVDAGAVAIWASDDHLVRAGHYDSRERSLLNETLVETAYWEVVATSQVIDVNNALLNSIKGTVETIDAIVDDICGVVGC